jgi:hypothetical protein
MQPAAADKSAAQTDVAGLGVRQFSMPRERGVRTFDRHVRRLMVLPDNHDRSMLTQPTNFNLRALSVPDHHNHEGWGRRAASHKKAHR